MATYNAAAFSQSLRTSCCLYPHRNQQHRRDHTLLQTEKLRERELKELASYWGEFLSKQELKVVLTSSPVLLRTNSKKEAPRAGRFGGVVL